MSKNLDQVMAQLAYNLFEISPDGKKMMEWLWNGFVLPPLVSYDDIAHGKIDSDSVLFKAGQQDVIKRLLGLVNLHKDSMKKEVKND